MSVYLVTVATSSEGYFSVLQESARRNGYDLIVLGMGQHWRGFSMKFKLMHQFLNTVNDNDIVIFVDAYDVVVVGNIDTLLDRFYRENTNILISMDCYDDLLPVIKYFYRKKFRKYGDHYINSGLYMGYVYAIRALFDTLNIQNVPDDTDDQLLLSSIYDRSFNYTVKIDTNRTVFYTAVSNALTHNKITEPVDLPVFLHAPGAVDMDDFLRKLRYTPLKHKKRAYFLNRVINSYDLYIWELLFILGLCAYLIAYSFSIPSK